MKSARQTMGDRSTALATLHGARAVVDSKRSKLNKLRGIPGIVVGTALLWIVHCAVCVG